MGLQISKAQRQATLDIILRPRPGTDLARAIVESTSLPSRFGSLRGSQAPFTVAATFHLAPSIQRVLLRYLDEVKVQNRSNLEQVAKRTGTTVPHELLPQVTAFFNLFEATIKSGRLDFTYVLTEQRGGLFLSSAAVYLSRARAIEPKGVSQLRGSADNHDPQAEQYKGWSISGGENETADALLKSLFGRSHGIHLAFGDDVIAFTQGSDSLRGIKRLIDKIGAPSASPLAAVPLVYEMSCGKILDALDSLENDFGRIAEVGAIRRKCFARDDRIRLRLERRDDGLRIRLELEEGYLRFMSEAAASSLGKAFADATNAGVGR